MAEIISRPLSSSGRSNYDDIFRKPKAQEVEEKPQEAVEEQSGEVKP